MSRARRAGAAATGGGPGDDAGRRRAARRLGGALALALGSAPLAARAEPPVVAEDLNVVRARQHFERGVQFFKDEAYDAAAAEFERANELAPSFRILYNLGLLYRVKNDYASGLRALQRCLRLGGAELTPARRSEVEGLVAELSQRVATVQVNVNVSGAEVSVDDVPVGLAPLGPLTLNPGRHKVGAARAGYATSARLLTLTARESARVDLDLVGDARPAAPAPPPPSPEAPGLSTPAIAAWGVTGSLAVALGVAGAASLSAAADLREARETLGTSPERLRERERRLDRWLLADDILLGAAAVGAGVAVYFTWLRPGPAAPVAGPASLRLGVRPGGLGLAGSF
jgi:tetratricopeptide (TPR) repeat protein